MDLFILVLGLLLIVLSVALLIERLRADELSTPPLKLVAALVVLAGTVCVFALLTERWMNAVSFGCLVVVYGLMIVSARRVRGSA